LDRERILFGADAFDVAARNYAGSFGGEAGTAFVDALYLEYQAPLDSPGKRLRPKVWLKKRLANAFPWVSRPPRWLDEPEWPYFLGKPMVFVGQLTVPATQIARELAAAGDEVYVFTAREYEGITRNWGIVYTTVSQSRAFLGALVVSDDGSPRRRRSGR